MIREILEKTTHHMDRAIEEVKNSFAAVRAGKATTSILDHVRVEYYGQQVPLNQISSLSCPEPRMIVVQPWEKNMLGPIEKAILTADLGLNPSNDGVVVRVPLPELSEERRLELVKQVHRLAEEGKVAVRNVRRDANDHLKKALKESDISEDEERRAMKDVQELTDEHTKQIDELLKSKETDIMAV